MVISHIPTSFAMSRQKIKLNIGCLRMQCKGTYEDGDDTL